ncbi:MAG: hypothetical protein R3F55_13230 [Alphaproteobacteria bacterium]
MKAGTRPSVFRRLFDRMVPSKRQLVGKTIETVRWADRRIPRVARTALGVPLIIGGLLSFLPVLGLWMLPAGLALVALDFPRSRRRLLDWIDRQEVKLHNGDYDSRKKAA